MQYSTKLIIPITLILVCLLIGCNRNEHTKILDIDEHTEILIIGPYKTTCQGFMFSEQECFLEFNEESNQWEFFYESIQGFDFQPGFRYTLKVSLHERPEEIQDVGRYAYRLVEVISKEKASVDERPPRKPTE